MGFPWAIAAGSASSAANIYGQMKANDQNLKFQREQRAWEENMANTAVQRRADDIEKAGGNRALAFANGASEASTPSVAPHEDRPLEYGKTFENMATAFQMMQVAAQTKKLNAEARITNVQADNMEKYGRGTAEIDWEMKITARDRQELDLKKAEIEKDMSAAQLQQFQKQWPEMLRQLSQQIEKGDLEVKQLRNIVNMGGLTSEDQDSLLRYFIDVFLRNK